MDYLCNWKENRKKSVAFLQFLQVGEICKTNKKCGNFTVQKTYSMIFVLTLWNGYNWNIVCYSLDYLDSGSDTSGMPMVNIGLNRP